MADQSEVTAYVLNNAGLAVVPFYAFGAGKSSAWYRLSVGTCKKEEIGEDGRLRMVNHHLTIIIQIIFYKYFLSRLVFIDGGCCNHSFGFAGKRRVIIRQYFQL